MNPMHDPSREDPHPNLPQLPPLPMEVICERLSDTLGGALHVAAVARRVSSDELVERLSAQPGNALSEVDVALIFEGIQTVGPDFLRRFSEAIGEEPETVLRCALLLRQREGLSEPEQLEDLRWETMRRIERADDE